MRISRAAAVALLSLATAWPAACGGEDDPDPQGTTTVADAPSVPRNPRPPSERPSEGAARSEGGRADTENAGDQPSADAAEAPAAASESADVPRVIDQLGQLRNARRQLQDALADGAPPRRIERLERRTARQERRIEKALRAARQGTFDGGGSGAEP